MYDIYMHTSKRYYFLHVIILHYRDGVKMTNYLTYVKKKRQV